MGLAANIGLRGIVLGVERVEVLLKPLVGRDAGIVQSLIFGDEVLTLGKAQLPQPGQEGLIIGDRWRAIQAIAEETDANGLIGLLRARRKRRMSRTSPSLSTARRTYNCLPLRRRSREPSPGS